MRTYEYTIELGRAQSDYVSFVHTSDEHVGAFNTDESLMQRVVTRIKDDPQCYWWDTGDTCELITMSDPRFEAGQMPGWFTFDMLRDPVKAETDRFASIFRPVSSRCLASVSGNHEHSIQKYSERDVYNEVWEKVGLPQERRLGQAGFLRLRFVSGEKVLWRVTVFMHHGTAGGNTKSSIMRQLESLPKAYNADIYCMGHSHKKVASSDQRVSMDDTTGRVSINKVYYSAAGSYMLGAVTDADGHYSERRLLYPQDAGPVEIRIYPNAKDIKVIL
jgi:hypothetical protein